MIWICRLLETVARFAMAAIFIHAGITKCLHWDETILYMQSEGMTQNTTLFLLAAASIEFFGGACLAMGYKTRFAAAILALFLIPVTYTFHHFWDIQAPALCTMQFGQFMKNLAIFGGLLFVACHRQYIAEDV